MQYIKTNAGKVIENPKRGTFSIRLIDAHYMKTNEGKAIERKGF